MLYNSYEDDEYKQPHRIIIFATRKNLKILSISDTWYVDSTFQVVPSIFFELFSIMGSVSQLYKGTQRKIALPLVHCLLENKTESAYTKALEVILSFAEVEEELWL